MASDVTSSVTYEHKLEIIDDEIEPLGQISLSRIRELAKRALEAGAPDDARWFISYRKIVVSWKTEVVNADPDGLPTDVLAWLSETYSNEGIEIWRKSYRDGDQAHREHLIRVARTEPMGT